MSGTFLPPHGGYQHLLSYQKSEIIYDATVYFTARFFSPRDRTIDQMVQAARSGKQRTSPKPAWRQPLPKRWRSSSPMSLEPA